MPSHTLLMSHMNFGAHLSKTRHTTVKISVSGSSPCYVELHFGTCWSTWRSFSFSKHECSCTSLRKHVIPTHSDSTLDCPAPFTTPHSLFLLFLPCIPHKEQGGRSSNWFVVFTAFYYTKYKYLVKNGGTWEQFLKEYFEKPGPKNTWSRDRLTLVNIDVVK